MAVDYSIQPIRQVADYFGRPDAIPTIAQVYTPGKGWKRLGFNKRVSKAYLVKLRQEGYTFVSLLGRKASGQVALADFSIAELTRTGLRG